MHRSARPLTALVWLALVASPRAVRAQDGDQSKIQVTVPAPSAVTAQRGGASVVTLDLLADAKTRELLQSGFAAQITCKLELWRKSGWFDDLESDTQWRVLASFDPVSKQYRIVRQHGNQLEDFGSFPTVEQAEAPIERPYFVPLRPQRRARYYYTLTVEVQALSFSDLDELQRWLRGEFQPTVRGHNSIGNMLKTGIGTLISRVLGGEKRHYEQSSAVFEN